MICPILLAASRITKYQSGKIPIADCVGDQCKWFNLCNAIQQADNIKLVPERKKK